MSRRRLPTLVAVGLVAAVGLAALVDSIRGDPELAVESAPTAASTEAAPEPHPDVAREVAALREAGAGGLLVVADPNCRVELLALPLLERTQLGTRTCELVSSGDAVSVTSLVPRPGDPSSGAACEGGAVAIVGRAPIASLAGCAPAWTPRGLLTFVRDGELIGLRDGGLRRLLSTRELERVFTPGLPRRERRSLEVVEVAWTSETRFTAILRKRSEPRYLIAVFDRGRLLPWRCCFPVLRRLRVSPGGGYVDLWSDRGALAFGEGGGFVPLGAADPAPANAIAFSPDDRFVAVAREGSVDVLDLDVEGIANVARIPVEAVDVRWIASEDDLVYEERN